MWEVTLTFRRSNMSNSRGSPSLNPYSYHLVAGRSGYIGSIFGIGLSAMIGGVSVHTGTVPSKTVREAIFQLAGFAVKSLYGNGSQSRVDISIQDVSSRVNAIVARETEVIRAQLKRNGIAVHQEI